MKDKEQFYFMSAGLKTGKTKKDTDWKALYFTGFVIRTNKDGVAYRKYMRVTEFYNSNNTDMLDEIYNTVSCSDVYRSFVTADVIILTRGIENIILDIDNIRVLDFDYKK